jgi:hypothetical protein
MYRWRVAAFRRLEQPVPLAFKGKLDLPSHGHTL